jgi:hypothetical protein
VTFFLDNTNPPRFGPALRAFDYDVHHLLEIQDFPKRGETLDVEWIMPKGFTKDPLWSQFQLIVKAWLEIVAVAERARPGDCYEVQRNGKVTIFVPKR